MNLLLVFAEERRGEHRWELAGARAARARELHDLSLGAATLVGELDGNIGRGSIVDLGPERVVVEALLSDPPPARVPVSFIVGVPRPQAIRRILQYVAMVGASAIYFTGSERGQKSYLQTPVLSEAGLQEYLLRGAEQAVDTRLPKVGVFPSLRRLFAAPPAELLGGAENQRILLDTDPGARPLGAGRQSGTDQRGILAIGPELGWDPEERGYFIEHGFEPVSLGRRILRVEVALLLGFALIRPER